MEKEVAQFRIDKESIAEREVAQLSIDGDRGSPVRD
jgi:hypothetical protein